ncbi:uncharacterized protein [Ambystoma mexicanum]|uniref:uncharacterized protein n=1 Tax=Ambystoma mexicanum TaxID=8296 RepID=UPI0037E85D21
MRAEREKGTDRKGGTEVKKKESVKVKSISKAKRLKAQQRERAKQRAGKVKSIAESKRKSNKKRRLEQKASKSLIEGKRQKVERSSEWPLARKGHEKGKEKCLGHAKVGANVHGTKRLQVCTERKAESASAHRKESRRKRVQKTLRAKENKERGKRIRVVVHRKSKEPGVFKSL